MKRKWYLALSLFALLIMFKNARNNFPINSSDDNKIELNDSSQIKVLSYNVKLFDFFVKSKNQSNHNKVLNYIIEKDADVVCLQEFGYYNKDGYLTEADIINSLSKIYKYRQIAYNGGFNKKKTYGVATFSKYPIIKKNQVEYDGKYNLTIYSDIIAHDDTIRLFNCHLESNQLTLDDKKKMKELADSTNKDKIYQATDVIKKKLGEAAAKRAQQADEIAKRIDNSPYKVIVCGDFNDSPISYTYNTVKGKLTDSFVNTSSGLGITYNEKLFFFRIDYILHSKEYQAGAFKVDNVTYSDHYPISCIIDLKPKPKK